MLDRRSLGKQVYDFLKEEMEKGRLLPGSSINTTEIASMLGISKTPLRDALIHLESEGFVDVLPRKGFKMAVLSLEEVKDIYELIGCLEGSIVSLNFKDFSTEHIDQMEELNQSMKMAVHQDDFASYYRLNLSFHNTFVDLCSNRAMKDILDVGKRRLYDFPRRSYIREWELSNCHEHDLFIAALRQGEPQEAERIIRDVHWSFKVQEDSIKKFYSKVDEHIQNGRSAGSHAAL
jgi:DNA-binding GntR family transcriptional regulator